MKSTLSLVLPAAMFALGSLLASQSDAAPPPTATGTIFYRQGFAINAINPDGSGHTQNVLPNYSNMSGFLVNANPAFYKSGGNSALDRWFLYTGETGTYDEYVQANGTVSYDFPHRDLFAVRSDPANRLQLIAVQLTDLYGIMTLGPAGGCWSNDDNDGAGSFVQIVGRDVRNTYEEIEDPETGEITTIVDTAQAPLQELRLPLTVSDLDVGGIIPVGPDTITEAELDDMLWAVIRPARPDRQGIISPDGAFVLTFPDTTYTRLGIADAATGGLVRILWDANMGAPAIGSNPHQWSPSGQTIAIGERVAAYPAGGNIWTQPADGSAVPKLLLSATTKGQTTTVYSHPVWSPDSKYLVVLKQSFSGTTLNSVALTRVSVADRKTLDLVPLSSSTAITKEPLRWVSSN